MAEANAQSPASRSPARNPRQLPMPVLGTLTFISSEVVFFAALLVAFLWYRGRDLGGPASGDLEVGRTALFSVALFASSATIALAERRLRRGDYRGYRTWLVATIALGATFLFGQVTEYLRLYAEGVTIGRNLFTSTFYTLTGFHGAHVAIGIVALGVLAWLAFAGELREGKHAAAEAVSVYWHFVDAVWVVLFSVIYLWTLV